MAGPPPHSVPDAFPAARYGDDGDGDPVAAPVPPPDPVLSSLGPGRMGTPPPPRLNPPASRGMDPPRFLAPSASSKELQTPFNLPVNHC